MKKRIAAAVLVAGMSFGVGTGVAGAAHTKAKCQEDHTQFTTDTGEQTFKNQGQCVSSSDKSKG